MRFGAIGPMAMHESNLRPCSAIDSSQGELSSPSDRGVGGHRTAASADGGGGGGRGGQVRAGERKREPRQRRSLDAEQKQQATIPKQACIAIDGPWVAKSSCRERCGSGSTRPRMCCHPSSCSCPSAHGRVRMPGFARACVHACMGGCVRERVYACETAHVYMHACSGVGGRRAAGQCRNMLWDVQHDGCLSPNLHHNHHSSFSHFLGNAVGIAVGISKINVASMSLPCCVELLCTCGGSHPAYLRGNR